MSQSINFFSSPTIPLSTVLVNIQTDNSGCIETTRQENAINFRVIRRVMNNWNCVLNADVQPNFNATCRLVWESKRTAS